MPTWFRAPSPGKAVQSTAVGFRVRAPARSKKERINVLCQGTTSSRAERNNKNCGLQPLQSLGYCETVSLDEALRRTVAWERAHPPEKPLAQFDYAAEDAAALAISDKQ